MAGFIEVVEEVDAEILVLGSFLNGGRGQGKVVIGSTADWLLRSSSVSVAIHSPRISWSHLQAIVGDVFLFDYPGCSRWGEALLSVRQTISGYLRGWPASRCAAR
ncbi:universal stress protein [Mycobacterium lepromatosis]|uniref:universal stress protein n=1 Tax=Mycobacterium lepromatosis TaxID=480418 RepID=UPI000B0C2C0E|nr:universal stress protein [Mycobacterium lepromatosis]